MSTGPKPGPGLIETNLADLDLAWPERESEAVELDRLGFGTMSLGFRLYALEIRIKAIICRRLNLELLPRACKTHDLSELVIFTGLWAELADPANSAILQNWELLVDFSKRRLNDLRYLPGTALSHADRLDVIKALDDAAEGVHAWLSQTR
jgi:hypothetical protein